MKKWVAVAVGLLGSLSLFISCHHKDYAVPALGSVSFALNSDDISGGRVASEQVSAVVISIKNDQGELVYENHKLTLLSFGQGYLSESLQLAVGNFTLTTFAILDSDNNVIYATPIKNSDKSTLVKDSLPIAFTVSGATATKVVPQVVPVSREDTPGSFGYANFGFELVNTSTINLNVVVKLLVGKYLYENNEATIVAKGFDAANNEKWSSEFHFVGPNVNVLPIESGYDHYTVSFQKWGVTDSQTLTAKQLLDDRADGSLPVTYVLAGKVNFVRKPTVVYTYSDDIKFSIKSRVEYTYNDNGVIQKITYFNDYSTEAASQAPSRYKVFTYGSNGNLANLSTYDGPSFAKTVEDTYQQGIDSTVLRITEANYSAAVTGTVDISINYPSQQTTAIYRYSNGRGFEYYYTTSWKDLVSSKETNGAELCNTGKFTYDRNINPFKHLNYTSYLVSENVSVNNTLTEDIDFIACAFPTLIPLSYDYKYDDMGYPTEKVTHYKGMAATSTTRYTYREFPQ